MLSKQNRLSLRTDRLRLEKEGRTSHTPLFIIVSARSSLGVSSPPRFAVLVTKKLAPLSVQRHRLRRIITEVLRHNLAKFPLGRDFLLIPKKPILASAPDQILSDLQSLPFIIHNS